ncbi:MAG: anti-sigma factor family protein [Sediminibacterium sp.]
MTMKINPLNYEYYFLMYIDNELSVQEEADLVEFITMYPNFAKELQDLQKTKINPTEIIFENKLSLYKISKQDINCISYLDNEMSPSERNAFEKSLANNPILNAELHEWRKTILAKESPNEIDFEFKKSLYKKEVVKLPIWNSISFKQWASIAALIILVFTVSMYQQNKSKNNFKNIVQINKDVLHPSSQLNAIDLKENQANTNQPTPSNNSSNDIMTKMGNVPTPYPITKNSSQYQVYLLHNEVVKNSQLQTIQPETLIAKISEPNNNDIAVLSQPQQSEINNIHATSENNIQVIKTSSSDLQDEINNTNNENDFHQIQYIQIDTEEEDRSINIANIEIDGAKFRALSRKITTLFKRNKPENEKNK